MPKKKKPSFEKMMFTPLLEWTNVLIEGINSLPDEYRDQIKTSKSYQKTYKAYAKSMHKYYTELHEAYDGKETKNGR